MPPLVDDVMPRHITLGYSDDIKADAVGVVTVRCLDGLVVKTSRCGRVVAVKTQHKSLNEVELVRTFILHDESLPGGF